MHHTTQRVITCVGLVFAMFLIAKPVAAQSTSEQKKLMRQQTINVDPLTGKRIIRNVNVNSGPQVNGQREMNNGKKGGGSALMSAPAAPPGSTSTTTSFTNSTPAPILDNATVTSTITVSGVGAYLLDLDLTTFITHTYASDLQITLMSPAGTIVTITSQNGAENDNVFNGTLWDDDANPGGQVAYSTNNGLVTDHLFMDLVTATPLAPEEAMGAFITENPNGVWTLTISDVESDDIGTLSSWTLAVTTLPSAPTTTTASFTNTTPVNIPNGPVVVTSAITVSGLNTYLLDLNMTIFVRYIACEDDSRTVDMTLMSPAGTIVTITTGNGDGQAGVFNGTLWDDDANPGGQVPYGNNNGLVTDHSYANGVTATPLVPEEAMAAFIGENPNGVWTLTISYELGCDEVGGRLDQWSLNPTTVVPGVVQDNALPSCAVTAVIPGPPKQIQVTVQDLQSGLQSVTPLTLVNATLNVPAFTVGTTSPVVVTATKINQSQGSSVVLRVTDVAGNSVTCDPVYTTISAQIPDAFALGTNYPNPFNPATKIKFNVAKTEAPAVVTLTVYDVLGREVKTLINEPMQAGEYFVEWDGTDAQGKSVTSGVYITRMTAGDFVATQRMALMK